MNDVSPGSRSDTRLKTASENLAHCVPGLA
jgi:hypothetical protein